MQCVHFCGCFLCYLWLSIWSSTIYCDYFTPFGSSFKWLDTLLKWVLNANWSNWSLSLLLAVSVHFIAFYSCESAKFNAITASSDEERAKWNETMHKRNVCDELCFASSVSFVWCRNPVISIVCPADECMRAREALRMQRESDCIQWFNLVCAQFVFHRCVSP